MQFKNGANVYSTDGKKVGHIDRVVMDPSTKEVTHVVVRQGTFFTEDKVVPVALIHGTIEDGVQLQAAAADLDDLPYFEETHYLPIDRSAVDSMDEPRSIYWYPPVGVVPVGDYPYYAGEPYRVETERNIPDGMIALKEGASVISADDQKVGNVERVYTDDNMKQATHLLIKDGWLFQTEKVIPVSWIDNVSEDKIRLTIDAPVLEQVPPAH